MIDSDSQPEKRLTFTYNTVIKGNIMKRHGIQIGKVIRFPGHRRMSGVGTYIVASAGRHKVTLFSPETGSFSVTRREFLKRGYKKPNMLINEFLLAIIVTRVL
ncbi:MAG: hypothetical protein J0665_11525 [Deltaproteobacteria bacterium]|nr:hypothetical protein [Deltaproteobacteria bacterium]